MFKRRNIRARRIAICLVIAVVAGAGYAAASHKYIERPSHPYVLESGIGTLYLNRYLGRPDEEPDFEADPEWAETMPRMDRFCRNVARRIKEAVGEGGTSYYAWVLGLGACEHARGWPLVSRDFSHLVVVDEFERTDGQRLRGHRLFAGQDGESPVRGWGLAGNGLFALVVLAPVVYGLLLVADRIRRRFGRPIAGFPVILADEGPSADGDISR